jgi:hypothetical protein
MMEGNTPATPRAGWRIIPFRFVRCQTQHRDISRIVSK